MKLKKVQKNLKESVGQDLSEYQKWVDYDMEKYGRISKDTFSKIKVAGLNVVRDQYGEYEVIAKRPIERNEIKEHVAVDRYDQLTKENVKPVIILKSNADGDILKDKEDNSKDKEDINLKESLTEDKEDSLQPHIDGLKSSVVQMEKKIKIAKEQAEKHPENRAFFNNMIKDLQNHIDYNNKQIAKFEKAEKVDLADVFNAKMMDRALTDKDEKNQEVKSDKIKPDILKRDSESFDKLLQASELLSEKSPNKYKYSVGDTYLDFGSDYQWTTIIAYKPDGSSYQALNPVQWEDIVNSKSDNELEKAVIDVLKDRFNPDRKRGIETAEDAMKALNELD